MKSTKDIAKKVELAVENGKLKLPSHMTVEDFIRNGIRYIKAIRQGRMICSIGSVSKSGMSRTMKFLECSGSVKNGFRYYNFYSLFVALGHNKVKDSDYFRIGGTGMDMVFHTNYSNIRSLFHLGFISEYESKQLEQKTPSII